jgi:uncharacterized membrane protein YqhA
MRKKEKASTNMFFRGGLYLFILAGVIGIFYQTLYTLVAVEAQIEDLSTTLIIHIIEQLGVLLIFFALVLVSFFFLKEEEFFKKHAGSLLIAGAVLSVPPVIYSLYEMIPSLREQTITVQAFFMETFPPLMENISKIYIFAGVIFLGIFLWGHITQRKWAAQFFIGGAVTGCASVAVSIYTVYETYKSIVETYGDIDKEAVFSRIIFPEVLKSVSLILVIAGVLVLSIFYVWKYYNFRKWTGRTWVFGGIFATFCGFINLALGSQMIRDDLTRVRQSIMELTPYTTFLREQVITVETMKEFYVKKMIPSYMDHSLWIGLFAAIALVGIYLWTKE